MRTRGTGTITVKGYLRLQHGGNMKNQHVVVAERALGRPLKAPEQVHHVKEIKTDNRPENLVLCQDLAYHKLLHQRADAFKACGHFDWLRCPYCKTHDDPANLRVYTARRSGRAAYHRACNSRYLRERYNPHGKTAADRKRGAGPDARPHKSREQNRS
jgi:hypothetical protein